MKELKYWNSISKDKIDKEVCSADITKDCLKIIESNLTIKGNILDLGCGNGRLMVPLAKKHRRSKFTGVDFSKNILDEAPKVSNVDYILNDGKTIKTKKKFDSGYSMLLFQHIENKDFENYLKEVYKVLKKGGKFLFQFVEGKDQAFLSHNARVSDVFKWCENAGFIKFKTHNAIYDVWKWALVEK